MKIETQTHRSRFGVGLLLAVLGACAIGIWLLSADARRELDALANANAESFQWSIAQSEVELLTLEETILRALREDPQVSLQTVRRRFDIFYSRMQTLQRSNLLERVQEEADVSEPVGRVIAVLDGALPLIDGPDEDLRAGLEELLDRVTETGRDLRLITLESVRVFAILAERQRDRVTNALWDLAVLVIALVLVLVTTVVALIWSLMLGRRRTAEIALAQSRLRTVVGTALDGVLVVGRDGRILDCNGAAERIFGYSREEAIGASMAEMIIPAHLREAHLIGMDKYLKTGQKRLVGKGLSHLEAKDKAGRVFPVELSLETAESGEGEIFVSFIRDISDRRAAEQELVEARDKALAGEEAKAEFLAVMSHEMRTPLNGILGGLELLSATDLSDRQKSFVDIMGRSGEMLLYHVNTVLDISRDDAGKPDLRIEPFDPKELLSDIVSSQSVQAKARGNALLVLADTDLGRVMGDRNRLSQVLVNLVANAIKFTRDGQITLSVQRHAPGTMLEFRVADTGIGIPVEDQPRIFEDFVTLDTRYTREVEGTGLGLGIARRLVTTMGGEIGVVSQPGEGAEFRVLLPLPETQETPSLPGLGDTSRPELSIASANLKILVVEDNDINRLVALETLTGLGCVTVEARDGAEAQRCAAQQRFDLILMDISMPGIDGLSATRSIRDSDGPNSATPIIALTAHALPSEIDRFHKAGMVGVLIKPLSRRALIGLIEQHFPQALALADGLNPNQENEVSLEILARAAIELKAHLTTIGAAIDADIDPQQIASAAHQAAGLAAVSGQTDLHNALVSLELVVSDLDGEEGEAEALHDMLAEARQLLACQGRAT